MVVGESAGAVAAPVYGGLVSDFLPDAQVTVYADGSGAYPDDPGLTAGINGLWGSFATMPAWEVNEGLTSEEWSIPRFWVQAGLHDPEIVMSRFDHAYDEVQTAFMAITGSDTTDIGAVMDANEAMIEEAGIVQHSFTAPGSDHTLVRDGWLLHDGGRGRRTSELGERRHRRRGRRRRPLRGVRRTGAGDDGLSRSCAVDPPVE